MIKLSRLADYGIVILCEMAAGQADLFSARFLSEKTTINEPTIMKILKLLVKAGIVSSVRGPKGGYALVNGAEAISILAVVEAIDGPVAVTLCSEDHGDACNYQAQCAAKGGWHKVNRALKETLEGFTIADFMGNSSMSMAAKADMRVSAGGVI